MHFLVFLNVEGFKLTQFIKRFCFLSASCCLHAVTLKGRHVCKYKSCVYLQQLNHLKIPLFFNFWYLLICFLAGIQVSIIFKVKPPTQITVEKCANKVGWSNYQIYLLCTLMSKWHVRKKS